ncbi:AAA family ATPase [Halogeometricum limi]|uniref:Transitional endoplasmic reticulum ATPase n=1 Tax=Halogeometricum limi TaxID=555875 RepID=A0A1I6IH26_9EURY|nr:AAA family ATPase [Halogeometricum limi]SFR65620.1 transitional endoplasmic reticulum ATPase [Halogeometricum limi]
MQLTVKRLAPRLEGFAIAAIPQSQMTDLGVHNDDHLGVTNDDRESVVVAIRPTVDADETDIVALDTRTRELLGLDAGDTVTVEPVSLDAAHRVTVAVVDGVPSDPVVRVELRRRLAGRAVREDWSFRIPLSAGVRDSVAVTVVDCPGEELVTIREYTDTEFVDLEDVESERDAETDGEVTYADLGGIDDAVEQVREMLERPLRNPDLYDYLGATPPSGVLLYGPPGTGKTMLARALATEVDAHFESIRGPEVFSKWFGESEANVREVFERARRNAPAIVFVDELDAIARSRGGRKRPEDRVVTQLLTLLDGLEGEDDVMVVATTNRVDDIDRALRRPGRFDREIEVRPPTQTGREEILGIHTRDTPVDESVDLADIARRTVGFTGADLAELVTEATRVTARRVDGGIDVRVGESPLRVTSADFEVALDRIEPSSMREFRVAVPDVGFDDVGGQAEAKHVLERAVVWPAQYAETFETYGVTPPSGVLLHGPPGTGKTRLATAVANAAEATFLSVKGSELLAGGVGSAVEAIGGLFERARENAPCVVFFDELDALAGVRGSGDSRRDTVVGQLLAELDGVEPTGDVFVLAATNRPDAVDDALVRPGRFEREVAVGLPDEQARKAILAIHTRETPLAADVSLGTVAEATDGYSGADLAAVCREAAMRAVDAEIATGSDAERAVTQTQFDAAVEVIAPASVRGVENADDVMFG